MSLMSNRIECRDSKVLQKCRSLCSSYLAGSWKKYKEFINVCIITGGMSNLLYYCELPDAVAFDETKVLFHSKFGDTANLYLNPNDYKENWDKKIYISIESTEEQRCLVRLYGQILSKNDIFNGTVIFTILSELKQGPRLLGVFDGGRIEEYIPAPHLAVSELYDAKISRKIANLIGTLHQLYMPLRKDSNWLEFKMISMSSKIKDFIKNKDIVGIEKFADFDYDFHIDFMVEMIIKTNSPVVFSHNDLQEGNILGLIDKDAIIGQLLPIDFEYSSYNYRGFDIANHFCEWMYDYNVDTDPYFKKCRDFPNSTEIANFLQSYQNTMSNNVLQDKMSNYANVMAVDTCIRPNNFIYTSFDEYIQNESTQKFFDQLVNEIPIFTMCSHLFWFLWSVIQIKISKVTFNYEAYAICRLESYKTMFAKKHP
ncbi:hypothetical protein A3Q56_01142 [Intoshia linei]|uniref:Choline/ethanolamine kinase n=1 Tax=Intoshia linei TaxID=1819745 RepID=A0A177B9X4_9BILA|nr:hypothetical protein A3Q56_01142 [Intoshia linei]